MNVEDIKMGQIVKCVSKTVYPGTWEKFLNKSPSRICRVYSIHKEDITVTIDNDPIREVFIFRPSDLAPVGVETSYSGPVKPTKPITLRALFHEGACVHELKQFGKRVVEINLTYTWTEIPPDVAQKVATEMGYPNWLREHGFVEEKKQVVTSCKVQEEDGRFEIKCGFNGQDSEPCYVVTIYKDGRGIERVGGLRGLLPTSDDQGRIIDLSPSKVAADNTATQSGGLGGVAKTSQTR